MADGFLELKELLNDRVNPDHPSVVEKLWGKADTDLLDPDECLQGIGYVYQQYEKSLRRSDRNPNWRDVEEDWVGLRKDLDKLLRKMLKMSSPMRGQIRDLEDAYNLFATWPEVLARRPELKLWEISQASRWLAPHNPGTINKSPFGVGETQVPESLQGLKDLDEVIKFFEKSAAQRGLDTKGFQKIVNQNQLTSWLIEKVMRLLVRNGFGFDAAIPIAREIAEWGGHLETGVAWGRSDKLKLEARHSKDRFLGPLFSTERPGKRHTTPKK